MLHRLIAEAIRDRFPDIAEKEGLCSMICVPLKVKDRPIGALNCYTSRPRIFSQEEINLLQPDAVAVRLLAGGVEDQEIVSPILIDLRSLVTLRRVFQGERVKTKLAAKERNGRFVRILDI